MNLLHIFIFIFLCFQSAKTDLKDYPHGMNIMIKNSAIDKLKDKYFLSFLNTFGIVELEDYRDYSWSFEQSLYNSTLYFKNLRSNQVFIQPLEEENTLMIKLANLEVDFFYHYTVRYLFLKLSINGKIKAIVESAVALAQPSRAEKDGIDVLRYSLTKVTVKINPKDIIHRDTEFYFLPKSISENILNYLSQNYEFFEKLLEGVMRRFLERTLKRYEARVPKQIDIKNTPLSFSTSVPSIPLMLKDRIELKLGGALFLANQQYIPELLRSSSMLSYNETDQSDIQIFINQNLLQSYIDLVKKIDYKFELSSNTLNEYYYFDEILTVGYFSFLFPFLEDSYPENTPIKLIACFSQNSDTTIEFIENGIKLKLSPALKIYAGEDIAFMISISVDLSASITTEIEGDKLLLKGKNPNISFSSIVFSSNKDGEEKKLSDEISMKIQYFLRPLMVTSATIFLKKGVKPPNISLNKFGISVDRTIIHFKEGYMQLSANINTDYK